MNKKNKKVTVIELSRRPMHPETIYVVFDAAADAQRFAESVSHYPGYAIDKINHDQDPDDWERRKWCSAWCIYYNATMDDIRGKAYVLP